MDTITQLRARIAEAQAQLATLRDAPPSHAEIMAPFNAHVKRETDDLKRRTAARLVNEPHLALQVRATPSGFVDLAPVLGMLLGPQALTKAFAAALAASDIEDAPKAADRAAMVERITAELDVLERDEETEICRLEATGRVIARRPNVRPEVVLAMPEESAK